MLLWVWRSKIFFEGKRSVSLEFFVAFHRTVDKYRVNEAFLSHMMVFRRIHCDQRELSQTPLFFLHNLDRSDAHFLGDFFRPVPSGIGPGGFEDSATQNSRSDNNQYFFPFFHLHGTRKKSRRLIYISALSYVVVG